MVRSILDSLGIPEPHRRQNIVCWCANDPFLPDRKRNYLGDDPAVLQAVRDHIKSLRSLIRKVETFERRYGGCLHHATSAEPRYVVGFLPEDPADLVSALRRYAEYLEVDLAKRKVLGLTNLRRDNQVAILRYIATWQAEQDQLQVEKVARKVSKLLDIAYELAGVGSVPSPGALAKRLNRYFYAAGNRRRKLGQVSAHRESP